MCVSTFIVASYVDLINWLGTMIATPHIRAMKTVTIGIMTESGYQALNCTYRGNDLAMVESFLCQLYYGSGVDEFFQNDRCRPFQNLTGIIGEKQLIFHKNFISFDNTTGKH